MRAACALGVILAATPPLAAVARADACEPAVAFTEPARRAEVAAKVTGILVEVAAQLGDRVRAGDLLARLDTTRLDASVAVARGRAAARGRLTVAEVQRAWGERRSSELQRLARSGAARPMEILDAETQAEIAAAQERIARDDIAVAELELAGLEVEHRAHDIRAPFSGVVEEVHRHAGESVGPGGPDLLRLVELDPLHVDVFVPAACAAPLALGVTVGLRRMADGRSLTGTVLALPAKVDEATGLRKVRLSLPNPELAILAGERVEVDPRASDPS